MCQFQTHSTEMVLAHLAVDLFELLLLELLAAQAPAPAQGLEALLLARSQPQCLRPPFKFAASRSTVLLQAVFTQQAVDPQPLRPMFRRSQIISETAPDRKSTRLNSSH